MGMGLYEYAVALRARAGVVLTVTLLSFGAALGLSLAATPQYESSTTLFFSTDVDSTNRELQRGVVFAQRLIRSYAAAATQPVVLEPVIRDLGLDTTAEELRRSVTALSPLGTVIIRISARDSSPERAAAIAQAIAARLSTEVDRLTPRTTSGAAPIRVSNVAPAGVPRDPVSPRTSLNVALALVLGLMAGAVLAIWLDGVDGRVIRRDDAARVTGLPVLGVLPAAPGRFAAFRRPAPRWLNRLLRRRGGRASALAQLRTNFAAMSEAQDMRVVLFLAATDMERSSTAATEVGRGMAHAGADVLVVDGDLRPSRREGEAAERGLSSVLRGRTGWEDVIRRAGEPHEPDHLPAGRGLNDPGAVLDSSAMAGLLADMTGFYDMVLLQSGPVLTAADGLALATMVDGVVVVGDRHGMRVSLLRETVTSLRLVRAPVCGVVLSG